MAEWQNKPKPRTSYSSTQTARRRFERRTCAEVNFKVRSYYKTSAEHTEHPHQSAHSRDAMRRKQKRKEKAVRKWMRAQQLARPEQYWKYTAGKKMQQRKTSPKHAVQSRQDNDQRSRVQTQKQMPIKIKGTAKPNNVRIYLTIPPNDKQNFDVSDWCKRKTGLL